MAPFFCAQTAREQFTLKQVSFQCYNRSIWFCLKGNFCFLSSCNLSRTLETCKWEFKRIKGKIQSLVGVKYKLVKQIFPRNKTAVCVTFIVLCLIFRNYLNEPVQDERTCRRRWLSGPQQEWGVQHRQKGPENLCWKPVTIHHCLVKKVSSFDIEEISKNFRKKRISF